MTLDEVRAVCAEVRERYGNDVRGMRSELHARLQLEKPLPGKEAVKPEHEHAAVDERITGRNPFMADGYHWVCKEHQSALWRETDDLLRQVGVL